MFSLVFHTDPAWAQQALRDIPSLLADHLDCERKASLTARSFARKWGRRYPQLVPEMEAMAREEEAHAVLVSRKQRELGVVRPPPREHPYAHQLRQEVNRGGASLLDLLLASSLIEARSCERFVLLARAAEGTPLGDFYEGFVTAEARHHSLFLRLAGEFFGEEKSRCRLRQLAEVEARIVASLPWQSRIH